MISPPADGEHERVRILNMKDSTKSTNPSTIRVRGAHPRASTSAPKLPTIKSDIVISIKPQFMDMIVRREKNHEYRGYIIPADVKRMWCVIKVLPHLTRLTLPTSGYTSQALTRHFGI